eukprot:COSAG01_NODE_984_length_12344_cov_215.085362_7_plen_60_part_00
MTAVRVTKVIFDRAGVTATGKLCFQHLGGLSVPLELFTTEWVMTLLSKVLPPDMVRQNG